MSFLKLLATLIVSGTITYFAVMVSATWHEYPPSPPVFNHKPPRSECLDPPSEWCQQLMADLAMLRSLEQQ